MEGSLNPSSFVLIDVLRAPSAIFDVRALLTRSERSSKNPGLYLVGTLNVAEDFLGRNVPFVFRLARRELVIVQCIVWICTLRLFDSGDLHGQQRENRCQAKAKGAS